MEFEGPYLQELVAQVVQDIENSGITSYLFHNSLSLILIYRGWPAGNGVFEVEGADKWRRISHVFSGPIG